jgi:hypothetical protein
MLPSIPFKSSQLSRCKVISMPSQISNKSTTIGNLLDRTLILILPFYNPLVKIGEPFSNLLVHAFTHLLLQCSLQKSLHLTWLTILSTLLPCSFLHQVLSNMLSIPNTTAIANLLRSPTIDHLLQARNTIAIAKGILISLMNT